jgi:ribonucleoside-diphosphate reductase alpha chain
MNESLKLLSDLTYYMKYSRYMPDKKRRETWGETIARNKAMHMAKFPYAADLIERAYELVLNKKILPSMRSMQFGGPGIAQNNARMYNCSAIGISELQDFVDLFYLLLCGCGVGFSVRRNFIEKLSKMVARTGKKTIFRPEDSIEGWADCIKALIDAYFVTGDDVEFDLSSIRPKGALIKSSMMPAPGPEPLREAIGGIKKLLDRKVADGEGSLSSVDCFDICCFASDAVLAGGVRRSAMICLFDKDDEGMLHAKEGEWWIDNPQRALANISVQFDRGSTAKEEFDSVFAQCKKSECGEPGFIWTNNPEWVINPCAEISMPSRSFCNLTSVSVGDVADQADLEERVYYASVIGTLQASYTNFKYIHPQWKENAEKQALIGVSVTGLASHPDLSVLDFKKAAAVAVRANEETAKLIGINPAERVTTIKPDGTGALVLGTSSGVHPWHAKHYIRRLRINKLEPIYAYLAENFPDLMEDDYMKPDNNGVLSLVMRAPEGAVTRRNETALEFLERMKYMFENWIKPGHVRGDNYNNVSCTCNVKNHEWDEVREWMWENRENYTGISLLPYSDASYQQAPFEDTNEEVYKEFTAKHREFKLDKIKEEQNFVNFGAEAACSAGGCELV